ncbi:DUF4411 family protein [Actinomyces respiraculi]|uniref:DUF4411 family protein n=1 Tax=Actinomyces respiraculi TaxID=2744574 RepID=UPI00141FA968|nr:DUF4411 family protein [Actinomyces respiraculi]
MYLVDANILIKVKNRYYAFDIAPGFWAWLDHAHACTVVAHETAGSGSRKRVKIPDACQALGVAWVSTFEMLRRTGTRLALDSTSA